MLTEPLETAPDPAFANIQSQMRRMMDQMQKNFFNFCPNETWTPNVNLYESDTAYLVCVDLAGVEKERIDVIVTHQKLTLRGARVVPLMPQEGEAGQPEPEPAPESDHGARPRHKGHAASKAHPQPAAAPAPAPAAPAAGPAPGADPHAHKYRVHLMEIDHGPFCREVELPEDVEHARIAANHRNGLLWIELPKKK